MWQCPDCGRKFSRNKQSHSCDQYDPEFLFIGKSQEIRNLCNTLIDRIREFGELDVYTGKWNLTLRHLSTFATILIEKNHLTLVFISDQPIDDFPVYHSCQHTGNRFSNAVKIESSDEIDRQLLKWLKAAWDLAV